MYAKKNLSKSQYVKKPKVNTNYSVKKVDKVQDKELKAINRKLAKLETRRELKYRDVTNTTMPLATGSQAISMTASLHRGDQYNEREGDNIYAERLSFSYLLTKPTSNPSPTFQFRIICLWDKNANGSGSLQVFTGVTPSALEEANALFDTRDGMTDINAPYSEITKDRYKILHDKIHIINNDSVVCEKSIHERGSILLHGAKVQYTDTESGGSNLLAAKNLIWLWFCAGSEDTNINFTSRLFYYDD